MDNQYTYEERSAKEISGWIMLPICILVFIAGVALFAFGMVSGREVMALPGIVLFLVGVLLSVGFKMLNPNEAYVLTLFGKYYGTIKKEGFFWVIPFVAAFNPAGGLATGRISKKLSLKAMTLDNGKQKVNDSEGNPIEIGVIVIWRIDDTAKAVFQVENYEKFISVQADAAIRNIARQYPYDLSDDGDEKSLRGSSQEIANMLCDDLQDRVAVAGIEIVEARISHLAYSQEIAAAMLQRQQAKAIVDARIKIVEGAVGMVELALDKLSDSGCVELDNDKKAQMVSNLMVVLCSNKDTQPIVNSGNIES